MKSRLHYFALPVIVLLVGVGCGVPDVEYPTNSVPEPATTVVSTGGTPPVVSTGGQPAQANAGAGGSSATASVQETKPIVNTGGSVSVGGKSGTGGIASGDCKASDTIRLIGNKIHDMSGKPFAARGPEMVVAGPEEVQAIDDIAATGANAMRMLFTLDATNGMTPAGFDTLIGRAVSHKMIVWVSLYTWDEGRDHLISDALGGGNFYSLPAPSGSSACSKGTPTSCYLAVWSRQWLKDLMAKYKGHVIIDAMQEFINDSGKSDTEEGRTVWAEAAKKNIRFFRGQGYNQPLEIMANFQGRDLYGIVEKGMEIRSVDTVKVGADPQTMFGWQAYWEDEWYKSWQGGLLTGGSGSVTGTEAIHRFVLAQTFPIQVGIDNYGGDTGSEYRPEIEQASKDAVSWLWWSWRERNGVENAECPVSGSACQDYVMKSADGFAGAVRSICGL